MISWFVNLRTILFDNYEKLKRYNLAANYTFTRLVPDLP